MGNNVKTRINLSTVYLNLYHVRIAQNWNFQGFNKFLSALGYENNGAFHVGVEVFGDEWQYGYCPTGSGVSRMRPRVNRDHIYKESLILGNTEFSRAEIHDLVRDMQDTPEWLGNQYNLNHRN